MKAHSRIVIPAKAGIQTLETSQRGTDCFVSTVPVWVPAFAGMTDVGNAIA